MDDFLVAKNDDEQFCANCSSAKTVGGLKKIRCVKGHWWNAKSEKLLTYGRIKWHRPGLAEVKMINVEPGYCADYDSMGPGLQDYLDSLPGTAGEAEILEKLSVVHGGRLYD